MINLTVEYYGSEVCGQRGMMGDYVRHKVDVFGTVEFGGKILDVNYQTGGHFYANNFNLPCEGLEISGEGTDEALLIVNEYSVDEIDFDDLENLPEVINTPEKFDDLRAFLHVIKNEAEDALYLYRERNEISDNPEHWKYNEESGDWSMKDE